MPAERFGVSLSSLVECAGDLRQVEKTSLRAGDWLIVKTCNSIYTLRMLGDAHCQVSGGWFDRHGRSCMKVRVNGCTWGGTAIKFDVLAACGLCLEFGNRVVTSPVQKIAVFPRGTEN